MELVNFVIPTEKGRMKITLGWRRSQATILVSGVPRGTIVKRNHRYIATFREDPMIVTKSATLPRTAVELAIHQTVKGSR